MKRLKLFACVALLFAPVLIAQQGYIPFATEFDGSADFYLRGADLTGNTNSKLGIISFWFRFDGGDGANQNLIYGGNADFLLNKDTSNLMSVFGRDVLNATAIHIRTSSIVASTTWKHFLASWDTGNGLSNLYISDVSDNNELTNADLEIDYTQTNYVLGATIVPSQFFNGAVSELYFAPGQYLDFSVAANRRLFITDDGKPVDLGPGCYKPTGTVAIVCMQTQFNNFGNNSGSGGDFTPQDPVTWTAGPVPILQLPGRAARTQARGRGGRGGRSR